MTEAAPEHPLVPAERVTGTRVFTSDGEKAGKITDLAIDKLSGVVAYAILGPDGLLDSHRRYRPVAWRLLSFDPAKGGYVVPLTAAELEAAAEAFDESELGGWTLANKAALI